MTTFSDNSSVDHQIENVYTQAASLFDPNTILNIERDEYARGVVELVTRLLGMDSDDKGEVASIISERTGTYRLTLKDFGKDSSGQYLYLGPLKVAVDHIKSECEWSVETLDNGNTRVNLDLGNCWGTGDTEELAWRYAAAAELGPTEGAEYEWNEFLLTK